MIRRRNTNLKVIPASNERGLTRDRLLVLLHARLTDILLEISPGLTLDEMMIRESIFVSQHRGEISDIEKIAKKNGISVTSANRKLIKLVAMGYIEKRKSGKKYVFSIPKTHMSGRYHFPSGEPVLDQTIDEIVNFIDTLVR